jgi:hypothetical protein
MASWFLNPIFFWVGVGAISAPIIIHLINRMRFRRIRWAAMEFLLKSQKRNRRRLIIEQMILLALRCLLVVLAGLLVARFVGAIWEGDKPTSHLVIIDDTLSMSDHWKDQGLDHSALDIGKDMIKKIAERANQTRAAQNFRLLRLSECLSENPQIALEGRLNDDKLAEIKRYLDDKDPKSGATDLHISPLVALRAAAALFAQDPDPKKVFYFVSDFRDRDWSGADAENLAKAIDDLVRLNVHVKMVDVANPPRGETRQVLLNHDNLAVTELRPESRVAPLDIPLQFTVTVHNYSNSEKKNVRVTIKDDGMERAGGEGGSFTFVSGLPPGPSSQTIQIPLRSEGFHLVTANIEPEETGLQADNIRYAVIEVKKQVPILVIDGDGLGGQKRPGGTFFLQNLYSAAKGYQIVSRNIDELSKPTLYEFPSVILLNVKAQDLGEKGVKNLEKYVQDGGGVAFFMGPRVEPSFYNQLLWRQGQGSFPVPLDRPTDAKQDPGEKIMRVLTQQPSIYIRDEQHPMFAELYKEDKERQINKFFPYIGIDRYYGVQKGRWTKTPSQDELITLPNRQSLDTYKGEAQSLIDEMKKLGDDEKNKVYRPGLLRHWTTIRDGLGGRYDHLFQLATDLDKLLRDPGDKNKPDQPNLVEFWSASDQKGLRRRLEQLRDRVQFGDPLMVGNRVGKGRVVVVLTAIGMAAGGGPDAEPWNDWPGGPGAPTFVILMQALQKYLTSVGDEGTLTVGGELRFNLDATRYEPRIRRFFQERLPEPPQKDDDQLAELELAGRQGLRDLGEQPPDSSSTKETSVFKFTDGKRPGMYVFHLYPRVEAGTRPKPETRAVVYNVDTEAESDLKRTERNALERSVVDRAALTGTVTLHGPDNPPIEKEKKTDLSEMPWFYLVILGVLVVEQALAVHLSFHLKGGEAPLPAAARPQPRTA